MRIVYCIQALRVGGAERRVTMLVNEAARRGHCATLVVARHVPDSPHRLAPAVNYVPLGVEGRFCPRGLGPLRRALQSLRPEIYHGFGNVGSHWGVPLARLQGVPLVVESSTSLAGTEVLSRLEQPFARLAVKLCHVLTVNSRGARASYEDGWRVPARKLELIPNFVDTRAYRPPAPDLRAAVRAELGLADDDVAVAMVARLAWPKDHANLVRAAALVDPRLRLRWLLIGDGPDRADLARLVDELGVGDRVTFLGARHDVPRLLAASDLCTLTSLLEGMPNALLEAMACGLPIVGTAVSGIEDLVVDGETGWLVPASQPQPLADAFTAAASDLARLRAFGTAARQRAEQVFDSEVVVGRFFDLYEARLAGPRPASTCS